MNKTLLYNQRPDSPDVQCRLCPHSCHIAPGHTGICHTRKNFDGVLYALNYGKLVAHSPDPVEKKPLYHFYPNHSTYSISSVGCNLECHNCQNSSISQAQINNIKANTFTPQDVVNDCLNSNCTSISYTYTEPTTLIEFVLDTATLSHEQNLPNIMVSNGYMSDGCIDLLLPHIQAINIDLKSFSNSFYTTLCHATLAPVLNTIERFFHAGVHLEITTLLIPGLNDDSYELKQLASFIQKLSPEIPWHISRFHPAYKLKQVPITPTELLQKAWDIGKDKGLHHVYFGNAPELPSYTLCHHCHAMLFERSGFNTKPVHFSHGKCTLCNTKLFGKFNREQ